MALTAKLELLLLEQRGHLYPWAPVALGLGIGLFFALKEEPGLLVFVSLGCVVVPLAWAALRKPSAAAPLLGGLALVAGGFVLAGAKAHWVAGPIIDWRYYGPVEGRIIHMDRSSSDALRLTLDKVKLDRVAPDDTPHRVRLSLHGRAAEAAPVAGSTIMLTGHLGAPSGPVEPGGFDFQRHAWFLKLGAVGYTRTPVMLLKPAGRQKPIVQARYAFADHVRAEIGGEPGAFAAAIMTGDRSGMSRETVDNLRHTNLAHLLAISGLHMGLLSGFVYAMTRYGLVLFAATRNRLPARKTAAVVALLASFCYLLLSGGSVATERAFIMATVALGAVFFERRVFSLRSVATAALIVLAIRPEVLLGPGFQMSFAATTALVSVFALLRDWNVPLGPRWVKPLSTVFISSAVAGLATAPIAAAHFNHFAHYGLLANLAAVPLMGALVVPAAVMAVLLYPLGLAPLAFWLMELGVAWILGVAAYFAGLDGARGTVVAPDIAVLILLALGFLTLVLWQGRLRLSGVLPALLAFVIWVQTERPDILISSDGKLVGLMTENGRALSAERGSGFVAANWLENDGDARLQYEAAALWPEAQKGQSFRLRHIRRKSEMAEATCKAGEILVVYRALETVQPCRVFDLASLRRSGAVALYLKPEGIDETTARDITGRRLWNMHERR
ncbi:ComEC family competence protein [Rhodobacteraceae bacterium 63075]|nr:ComEC family competence protein [Rhodobacteraceae bacterium 63075]